MMLAALLALALQGPRDPMLVSAGWLAQHQHDANLVLVHIGPRASFDTAHIAGAQFPDLNGFAAPRSDTTIPALSLPAPATLDSTLEAMGVSDNSRIVLYSSDGYLSPATRVYFTLFWAGLGDRTSILDGGLAAWRARGGAVTAAATPPARRGSLVLHPRPDAVVTTDWVRSHLEDPTIRIVDARDTRFYMGTGVYRDTLRQGHIPGAYNIPFLTVADTNGIMLAPDRLAGIFQSVRAAPGDTVVTYCHIGQQGTLVWFAARLAGYQARLYDDSFTEWNTSLRNPVEKL